MTINQMVSMFYPVLLTILTGALAYVGKEVLELVPILIDGMVAKIGFTNYTKMKAIALDIWNKIEEDGRLGKLVESKVVTFENLIKAQFPSITDAEIDLFNKSIAGEVNKDKPIVEKAIEKVEPTITVATPIIKYYATDGVTELAPVVATVTAV